MKIILRALLVSASAIAALSVQAADGVAFITNLKGEVAVDGAPRPMLMSELARGQKIVVGKEAQIAIMYIQSGKEYLLKGPGDYLIGEREITSGSGVPPAARETAWRASNQVLVKVAQTSSASIRMRSIAPAKVEAKPTKLDFPTQGAVTTLQPTLRWTVPDANAPAEVAIAVAGKRGQAARQGKGFRDEPPLLDQTSARHRVFVEGFRGGTGNRLGPVPDAARERYPECREGAAPPRRRSFPIA